MLRVKTIIVVSLWLIFWSCFFYNVFPFSSIAYPLGLMLVIVVAMAFLGEKIALNFLKAKPIYRSQSRKMSSLLNHFAYIGNQRPLSLMISDFYSSGSYTFRSFAQVGSLVIEKGVLERFNNEEQRSMLAFLQSLGKSYFVVHETFFISLLILQHYCFVKTLGRIKLLGIEKISLCIDCLEWILITPFIYLNQKLIGRGYNYKKTFDSMNFNNDQVLNFVAGLRKAIAFQGQQEDPGHMRVEQINLISTVQLDFREVLNSVEQNIGSDLSRHEAYEAENEIH